MDKIQLAIDVAKRAHKGQTDKLGEDYINHPLRVHRNLKTNPKFKKLNALTRMDCEVAALLHDVIEDSGKDGSERFTKQDLLDLGFTPRSIELVDLLTRDKNKPKDEYYKNIQADSEARLVKLADIADNRNHKRVEGLSEGIRTRLGNKYRHAMEIIVLDEEDDYWMQFAIDFDLELQDYEDDSSEDEG